MRILAALAGLCLAVFASAPPAYAQPTGAAVAEGLLSGDPARAEAALAAVNGEPGAYAPMLYVVVARTLADRGDLREAAKWQIFGDLRLASDLVMLAQDAGSARLLRPMAVMSGFYVQQRDPRVSDYIRGLPRNEGESVLADATRLNANAPRLYPPNWPGTPREGPGVAMNTDWTATPAQWPERALAIRTLVGAILMPQFRDELGLNGILERP